MNTDQKYAGKGNYANPIEQTAKTQAETKPTYQALNPQTVLLSTVRTFCTDREVTSVVEVINDLTRDWLNLVLESNADADRDSFSKDHITNVLFNMYKVTEFIVKLEQFDNQISQNRANAITQMQDDLTESYEEQIDLLNQLAEAREQTIKILEERINLLSPPK